MQAQNLVVLASIAISSCFFMKQRISLSGAATLLLLANGCAVNPVTCKKKVIAGFGGPGASHGPAIRPQNRFEEIAILNGLQLNAQVNASSLIRVVGK